MRQIEVTGNNQKQLEIVYHNKIHEINATLKKMYEQYNNWDAVDEKQNLSCTQKKSLSGGALIICLKCGKDTFTNYMM